MIDQIAIALAGFFDTEVHRDERGIRTLVRSGEAYFTTRVRLDPVAEIFISTRPLDGFELALRWNDRWGNPDEDAEFHDAFWMATNDHEMSRLWLDEAARRALLDSAYTFQVEDPSLLPPGVPFHRPTATSRRTWTYELSNDELVVTKGGTEHDANRIALAITAGCAIAGRSQRWARQYAEVATRLGVTARSDLEIGGKPIITVVREGVDVGLQLLRRLPGEKAGRLRTLISARRVNHEERTLSIVDESAVRAALPTTPRGSRRDFELEGYRLRTSDDAQTVDERVRKLVVAARPSAVVADLDSIDVWFDGAPLEHDRLDPAFALAARLAVGNAAQQGPYR